MDFSIFDPFFKRLYPKLAEHIQGRINSLANGSAVSYSEHGHVDAVATAFRYKSDVAYIEALQEVIALCRELDRDLAGIKKENDNDGDY